MPLSTPHKRRRTFGPVIEQLEARCVLATGWTVTFDDAGAAHAAYYDRIRATTLAAGQEWNRFLPSGNGTIDVSVKFAQLTGDELARGGSATTVLFEENDAVETRESGVASEIRTGTDPNGNVTDAIITLNIETLTRDLWFDPTPNNPFDEAVPRDQYDAFSLILHELGHALGISGFRDQASGQLPGNTRSRFDTFVTLEGSVPYFHGPEAKAAYGNRPLALTEGNLYHVKGSFGELNYDLMSEGLSLSQRRSISSLDAAILQDIGLPIPLQPLNTPPFLSDVENQVLLEDEVREVPLALGDLDTIHEALSITITSNNPALFPQSGLELFRNRLPRFLMLRPADEASGSATITISVGDGSLTTVKSFQVTVTPFHDPPQVFVPPPKFMLEDQSLDVYLRLESVEVPVSQLIVTASSTPASLFGPGGITISNEGEIRVARLVPAKNQHTGYGYATLQFVVSDGVTSSTGSMQLEVRNTPDPPHITPIDPQYLVSNESRELTFQVKDDHTVTADGIRCSVESSDPSVVAVQLDPLAGARTLTLVARTGARGLVTITLRARSYVSGAGESFEEFRVFVSDSPHPWQNPEHSLDVDHDGVVAPLDVLLIINYLNAGGGGPLEWPHAEFMPTYFYDVHPDNHASPLDALLVINYINARVRIPAEGEPSVATIRDLDRLSDSSDSAELIAEDLLMLATSELLSTAGIAPPDDFTQRLPLRFRK